VRPFPFEGRLTTPSRCLLTVGDVLRYHRLSCLHRKPLVVDHRDGIEMTLPR
jgi:hypothetical protein